MSESNDTNRKTIKKLRSSTAIRRYNNKISAKNYRAKRKEYINTLETSIKNDIQLLNERVTTIQTEMKTQIEYLRSIIDFNNSNIDL